MSEAKVSTEPIGEKKPAATFSARKAISDIQYSKVRKTSDSFAWGYDVARKLAYWTKYDVGQVVKVAKTVKPEHMPNNVDVLSYRVGLLFGYVIAAKELDVMDMDVEISADNLRSLGMVIPGDVYTAPKQETNKQRSAKEG